MKPLLSLCAGLIFPCASILSAAKFEIATFSADVTVPMGHGMMGGLWKSKSVADPLFAKGVVLTGGDKPVVFVSVDWCEIRNASFDRWREVLARAAGTTRERVLVSAIHQHDALTFQHGLVRAVLLGDRALAAGLGRLDEGPAHIVVPDDAHLEGDAGGF